VEELKVLVGYIDVWVTALLSMLFQCLLASRERIPDSSISTTSSLLKRASFFILDDLALD